MSMSGWKYEQFRLNLRDLVIEEGTRPECHGW